MLFICILFSPMTIYSEEIAVFFFHVLGGCSGRKTREGREMIEGVGAGVAAKRCLSKTSKWKEERKGREGREGRESSDGSEGRILVLHSIIYRAFLTSLDLPSLGQEGK